MAEGKLPVIIDHDGGVDDLVAMALLLTDPKIDVLASVVIDADCFIGDAYDVSRRLMCILDMENSSTIVAKSTLLGKYEFPIDWRGHGMNMAGLPVINTDEVNAKLAGMTETTTPGEQVIADCVLNSPVPVTIVVTGPLTNIAWCVEKYGDKFCRNVRQLVVMGGAVDVEGNVLEAKTDKSAEWNIYWDAPGAKVALMAPFEVVLFALDSTNHVPVTLDFVRKFGASSHMKLSNFVGSAWAMCTHYDKCFGFAYYAWDALTAAYVLRPDIVRLEKISIEVVVEGPSEGRTKRVEKGAPESGEILLALDTNADAFYSMCLEQFKR